LATSRREWWPSRAEAPFSHERDETSRRKKRRGPFPRYLRHESKRLDRGTVVDGGGVPPRQRRNTRRNRGRSSPGGAVPVVDVVDAATRDRGPLLVASHRRRGLVAPGRPPSGGPQGGRQPGKCPALGTGVSAGGNLGSGLVGGPRRVLGPPETRNLGSRCPNGPSMAPGKPRRGCGPVLVPRAGDRPGALDRFGVFRGHLVGRGGAGGPLGLGYPGLGEPGSPGRVSVRGPGAGVGFLGGLGRRGPGWDHRRRGPIGPGAAGVEVP